MPLNPQAIQFEESPSLKRGLYGRGFSVEGLDVIGRLVFHVGEGEREGRFYSLGVDLEGQPLTSTEVYKSRSATEVTGIIQDTQAGSAFVRSALENSHQYTVEEV